MEKKKRGKTLNLKINFTNRWLYTSITFLVVAVLAAFVYAQNPDVFGHHYDDLDLGPLDIESDLVIIDGGTGKALRIVGSNHVFQEFYSQGLSNSRSGYIGYGSGGTNHLTIANQKSGGDTIFRINSSEGSWLESMRITSSGIDVSGNVQADSLDVNGDTALNGLLNVSGNATANYFIGDGSQLTGIDSGLDIDITPKSGVISNARITCPNAEISGNFLKCDYPKALVADGLGFSGGINPRVIVSDSDARAAACLAITGEIAWAGGQTSLEIGDGSNSVVEWSPSNQEWVLLESSGPQDIINQLTCYYYGHYVLKE